MYAVIVTFSSLCYLFLAKTDEFFVVEFVCFYFLLNATLVISVFLYNMLFPLRIMPFLLLVLFCKTLNNLLFFLAQNWKEEPIILPLNCCTQYLENWIILRIGTFFHYRSPLYNLYVIYYLFSFLLSIFCMLLFKKRLKPLFLELQPSKQFNE